MFTGEQVSIIREHQAELTAVPQSCCLSGTTTWQLTRGQMPYWILQHKKAVWRRALPAKTKNFLMVVFLLWERGATQHQQCVYKESEYAGQAGKYPKLFVVSKLSSTLKGKFSVWWGKLHQCPIYRETSWNIDVESCGCSYVFLYSCIICFKKWREHSRLLLSTNKICKLT